MNCARGSVSLQGRGATRLRMPRTRDALARTNGKSQHAIVVEAVRRRHPEIDVENLEVDLFRDAGRKLWEADLRPC